MANNSLSLDRIMQRGKEIATFNTRTYEEVSRDPNATMEAAIVVAVVAVSSGLGRLFQGPGPLIGGIVSMLLGWVVAAAVIYFVGSRITGAPTTSGSVERVMRAVGYAAIPNVFAFLTSIWFVGWLIAVILFFWMLITMILAIRASLNMTLGRAAMTGFLAWIASIIVMGLMQWIFGINFNLPF